MLFSDGHIKRVSPYVIITNDLKILTRAETEIRSFFPPMIDLFSI